MAQAWVTCKVCRTLMRMGTEHRSDGKSLCDACYKVSRAAEAASEPVAEPVVVTPEPSTPEPQEAPPEPQVEPEQPVEAAPEPVKEPEPEQAPVKPKRRRVDW